ncbi:hypothetical protein GCM10025868_44320 [Angustibacter aerolatus]|uniref:Uncharacterized protein n=1 Tax=Angustibacter aerolatus TaxID=1162965 RepID=A0ABQ6JN28_9ACTN|nr:hypothetical protein GCM10025868_44320 [Angustibacter aerolatus]
MVDGALALVAAARAGTRAEDHRVAPADRGGELVDRRPLEVEQHRGGTVGLDVGDVVRVAHDRQHLVAAGVQQPRQPPGDLPVTTRDRDPHDSTRSRMVSGICCSRVTISGV